MHSRDNVLICWRNACFTFPLAGTIQEKQYNSRRAVTHSLSTYTNSIQSKLRPWRRTHAVCWAERGCWHLLPRCWPHDRRSGLTGVVSDLEGPGTCCSWWHHHVHSAVAHCPGMNSVKLKMYSVFVCKVIKGCQMIINQFTLGVQRALKVN